MARARLATDRDDRERRNIDTRYPFVDLRIPADRTYVRVARLAAGYMGSRVDFSIDELDDVRLAVDEVCATVIEAGGQRIEIRMQVHDRALIIEGRVPDARSVTAPSDLSELLLRALVDSCTFTARDGGIGFEMYKLASELA
jgi:anti-sigma regulatory factor (Ser/Thr protein kinase)